MEENRMKKWLVAIFVSVLLMGMLAACSSQGEPSTTSKSEDKELKKVTVMLDWYPNAVHSFLYVAEEKGYFKEEGLDVELQFPANPTDPLNLAAAGKITLGFYYQPDVVMARTNEEVPVKSVGTIVRSPLNRLITLKESGITRPKDLEGKTVGFIENDGGDPDTVKIVDVGFELNSSLISKKADAVIGAFINHEVPLLQEKGYDVVDIDPANYGVPSYYELVAVTGDQTWEKDSETIKAFWRAATKGFEYTKNNPEESLQILLNNQDQANFPLEKSVETKSLDILLPKMVSEDGFGSQTEQSWQDVAHWLKENELITKDPVVKDMFVDVLE